MILLASALLLAIYLANTGLTAVVVYWGHLLGINIETEMRRRAFDHLQKLSFSFYDNAKTGNLITHVTKDLEDVGEVAHHGPEDLFIAIMTFVGAFALMFTVNWRLALLTTIITPVVAVVSSRYGGAHDANFRALFRQVGAFNARIEQNVGGMRVVQAFANEEHERAAVRRRQRQYRRTKLQAYRLMAARSSITYLGMRLTQMVVMVAGTWFVLHGQLSEGGFVSFLLLVGVFLRPVEKINGVLETYPKGIAGFRRYTDLLAVAPDIVDRPGAQPVRPAARRHPVRGRDLRLRRRPNRAARHRPRGGRRRDRGLRRAVRRRQDHAVLAAAALLRAVRRPHHHRRHGHRGHDPGLPAQPDRHRAAGRVPVRRHGAGEHRLWPARRGRGRHPRRGAPRPAGRR